MSPTGRLRGWRRGLGLAVVVAAVVLDVVVVGAVQERRHREPSAAALSEDAGPFGWQPARAVVRTPGPDELIGPVLLSAARDGTVLRSNEGSCADEQAPQVSVLSAGGSPRRVAVPGATQVTGLEATDDALEIAGLDATCRPTGWSSTDDGRTWRRGEVPTVWRLATDADGAIDPSAVLAPEGRRIATIEDCQPQTVQPATPGTAVVACLTGTTVQVRLDGSEPVPLMTVYGLRAAAADSTRTVAGLLGVACPALVSVIAGASDGAAPDAAPAPRCLDRTRAVTGLTFTPDGDLLVQAGNSLYRLAGLDRKPQRLT